MCALVADSSAPGGIAFQDVPEPTPAPGEVLVEVRAFSINRGELRMLGTAADGWRPGWDFAGILLSDVEHACGLAPESLVSGEARLGPSGWRSRKGGSPSCPNLSPSPKGRPYQRPVLPRCACSGWGLRSSVAGFS
jgi:hypothetical protein